jgi:hypothetical protein
MKKPTRYGHHSLRLGWSSHTAAAMKSGNAVNKNLGRAVTVAGNNIKATMTML